MHVFQIPMDSCPLFKESIDSKQSVKVHQKGADGIIKVAKLRDDFIYVYAGDAAHLKYRRDYTNTKALKTTEAAPLTKTRTLRSAEEFDFKDQCLFCLDVVKVDDKNVAMMDFGFQY